MEENSGLYIWNISNFSRRGTHMKSERFKAGDHQWHIILFPKGGITGRRGITGIYVAINPNVVSLVHIDKWRVFAKFSLSFINQKSPSLTKTKETIHCFTKDALDWGFNSIVKFNQLTNPKNGFIDRNGALQIECVVEVLKEDNKDVVEYIKKELTFDINVKVVTISDMEKHDNRCELVSWDDIQPIKMSKKSTLQYYSKMITTNKNIPPERQRYWKWQNRVNKTIRPNEIYTEQLVKGKTLEYLNRNNHNSKGELKLFLDVSKAPAGVTDPEILFPLETVLIFLKTYHPENSELIFLTYTYLPKTGQVKELIPLVKEKMSWPKESSILVFEEIKPSWVEPLDTSKTLEQADLGNGDILIFQLEVKDDNTYNHPLTSDFYKEALECSCIKRRRNTALWSCIRLMYIGHKDYHCIDTFGKIPPEVIGVICRFVVANPYISIARLRKERREMDILDLK